MYREALGCAAVSFGAGAGSGGCCRGLEELGPVCATGVHTMLCRHDVLRSEQIVKGR